MLPALASLWLSGLEAVSPPLPAPDLKASVTKRCKPVGWADGQTPVAPPGFTVSLFAKDLVNPRWLYVLRNGDVLVSEAFSRPSEAFEFVRTGSLESARRVFARANRIVLFRDRAGNAPLRDTFLSGLTQPFGMLERDGTFLVADTDAVLSFPYRPGQTRLEGESKTILSLPASGYHGHWTRNLVQSPDGKKLYVTVGSATNDAEDGMEAEMRRADILELNPDGSGEQVYASGLRNPVGAAFYPGTNVLWTAVNERDDLGDDVPPDYLTHVERGGFYGWPYSYFGQHVDPRQVGRRPDLVAKAIVPDLALGAHSASLGLQFYEGDSFGARYKGGAFIGQHGSWNRSTFAGYRVVFVPFANGMPSGPPEPFLTGFIADESSTIRKCRWICRSANHSWASERRWPLLKRMR